MKEFLKIYFLSQSETGIIEIINIIFFLYAPWNIRSGFRVLRVEFKVEKETNKKPFFKQIPKKEKSTITKQNSIPLSSKLLVSFVSSLPLTSLEICDLCSKTSISRRLAKRQFKWKISRRSCTDCRKNRRSRFQDQRAWSTTVPDFKSF